VAANVSPQANPARPLGFVRHEDCSFCAAMKAAALALVVLGCASSPSTPTPDSIRVDNGKADGGGTIPGRYDCPAGARFATNDADNMFCLFEGITPPADASSYCDYVDQGYIGFDWPTASAPDYTCPADANARTNGDTLSFCLYDVPPIAPATRPYCDYLGSNGTIGYEWSVCPEGGRVAGNGQGTTFCVFESLALAPKSRPYCDYVTLGYIGFYFPENAAGDYECPAPFTRATNGAGTGFCLLDNLALPSALDVQPYCDLDRGYVGFYWPQG
jgi:hypothetical protein